MAVLRTIRRGITTGVYGGPIGQTVAVALFAAAVFVGAALATGYITWSDLAADPIGAVWRTIEPTARSLWP